MSTRPILLLSLFDARYAKAEKVYNFDDQTGLSLRELLPIWLNHGGSIEAINSQIPDDPLQSGESPFDHKRERDDFIKEIVEQADRLKEYSQFSFVAFIDSARAEYDFEKGILNICLPQFVELDRGFDYGIKMKSGFLSQIGVGNSSPILILSYRGLMSEDRSCRSGSGSNGQNWFSRARVSVPVGDVNEAERLYNQINSGALEVAFSLIPESRANLLPFVAEVTSVRLFASEGNGGFSRSQELVNLNGEWKLIEGSDPSDDDRSMSFDVDPITDLLGEGRWSGWAVDGSGEPNFEVMLNVGGGKIDIDYPQLNCGASLSSGIRVGKTYSFNSNISHGKDRCTNGIAHFEVLDSGSVVWRWRGLNSMFDEWQAILALR